MQWSQLGTDVLVYEQNLHTTSVEVDSIRNNSPELSLVVNREVRLPLLFAVGMEVPVKQNRIYTQKSSKWSLLVSRCTDP